MKKFALISMIACLISSCSAHVSVLPDEKRTTADIMLSPHKPNGNVRYRVDKEIDVPDLAAITATSREIDNLNRDFQRIQNPNIVGFVYAHTSDEIPIPGYTTLFKLYDRDHIAVRNIEGVLMPRAR